MNLQDKLISLSDYNIGFNVNNGKVIVNITYRDNWEVVSPEGNNVELLKGKDVNTYFYTTTMDDGSDGINGIFKTIDETIKYNREVEDTIELFRRKTEELQKLFEEKTYDELKTLTFTIKEKKPKITPKKKVKAKEVNETTKEEKKTEKKKPKQTEIDKKIEESIKKVEGITK